MQHFLVILDNNIETLSVELDLPHPVNPWSVHGVVHTNIARAIVGDAELYFLIALDLLHDC